MSCSPLLSLALSFAVLCCASPSAQTKPNYHMELVHPYTFPDGTVWAHLALVNDSDKTIETFHITSDREDEGGITQDALDLVSHEGNITFSDQETVKQNTIIKPGARFISLGHGSVSGRSVPVCVPKIDAVLFTDGTFEGDEPILRGIEAYRRGMADGVKYWSNRLATTPANRSALEALSDEAQQRKDAFYEDEHRRVHQPLQSDLTWQYQAGREWADIVMNGRLVKGLFENEESSKLYKNAASYFAEWKDEIDNDAALKTLIAAFPLPDAFTAQGDNSLRGSVDTKH
jgi:hypothetical protein